MSDETTRPAYYICNDCHLKLLPDEVHDGTHDVLVYDGQRTQSETHDVVPVYDDDDADALPAT